MSPPIADSTKNVESKCSQRKINKPLIEKRRRARINDCLAQLKTIVLEANHSKSPRPSKLEKADILEMTVEFVKNKLTTDSGSKCGQTMAEDDQLDYVAGYSKCLAEISHFLEETKPVNDTLKQDIVEHVSDKLKCYLIKDSKEDTTLRKLPIPPLCKRSKESKIVSDEAMDLSVCVNNNERTDAERSAAIDNNVPKELSNQKTEPATINNINQSGPFGLLCGGQVMLLVQLPQSVTSQVQIQNFQNINQSQSSIPMVGVQPMSVASQPHILNQTMCRSDQTLICPTPLTFPQVTVTGSQIEKHQSFPPIYPTIQSDSKGKHENHWRPW